MTFQIPADLIGAENRKLEPNLADDQLKNHCRTFDLIQFSVRAVFFWTSLNADCQ